MKCLICLIFCFIFLVLVCTNSNGYGMYYFRDESRAETVGVVGEDSGVVDPPGSRGTSPVTRGPLAPPLEKVAPVERASKSKVQMSQQYPLGNLYGQLVKDYYCME